MGKVDIVKEIFEDLKNNHKNLFHSVEKEVVDKEIEKLISKANSLNDEEFIYELSKIFALFKDAHTRVNFKFEPFENFFCYLNGKVYFKDEKHNFLEVKTICNIEIENLIKMIEPILCYETEEWRDHLIENRLNNINSYKILGLIDKNTQKIDVELQNGEKLELNKFVCKTNYQPKPSYEYRFIGDILYLRYRRCCEDELKFCDFLEQIEKDLNANGIRKYILDIRNNGGGNSEIINPFMRLIEKFSLKGVIIMNRATFSSARFIPPRFKKAFNTPTIGQTTGGAVRSYGNCINKEIEGINYSYSTKYFDFSNVYDYDGGTKPDYYLKQSIDDLRNGKDRELDFAIEFLKNESEKNQC